VLIKKEGSTARISGFSPTTLICGGPLAFDYALKEIRYHFPSEHQIDGKFYPLEVQFVHRVKEKDPLKLTSQNNYAILSFLFAHEKRRLNNGLKLLKNAVEKIKDSKRTNQTVLLKDKVRLTSFFPHVLDHYIYNGSFTSAPCVENVTWVVFSKPTKASIKQVNCFRLIEILHNFKTFWFFCKFQD